MILKYLIIYKSLLFLFKNRRRIPGDITRDNTRWVRTIKRANEERLEETGEGGGGGENIGRSPQHTSKTE